MRVQHTTLAGVLLFLPTIHRDDRGLVTRTFDAAVALAPKADWDLAAADLIAAEAGAYSGDHRGRGFLYNGPDPQQASLVCAAPRLAPLILNRVGHIALGN